ncbi:nucleolar protein dao-5-like isoform X2 [Lampris incognitus]|uniref:nucleolar protein dao-5-like isoform X2 n=1 Tax=Lampris incognitus TaxID=2546036 RepID=UPI0024B6274A|nr:nucleolar protein dao-5-like isoform X2 [Lampris incognitus]
MSMVDDPSDDDIPLSNFLEKRQRDDTHQSENTQHWTLDSDESSGKDKSDKESCDDNDDDVPLVEFLKKSQGDQQQCQKTKCSALTSNTSLAKENDDGVSSDDEPLNELSNRVKTRPPTEVPLMLSRTRTKRSKNSAPEKLEPSSDSSNEPLIKTNTRKSLSDKKVSSNGRKTKPKDDVPMVKLIDKQHKPVKKMPVSRTTTTKRKRQDRKDGSSDGSSDDDVPLAKLFTKHDEPAKKTPVSRSIPARRKKQAITDESSDDEPLTDLGKTKLQRGARNATTPKRKRANASPKKAITPARASPKKQSRKQTVSNRTMDESSIDSSDVEPLIKITKHPQVTKFLRVALERCDEELPVTDEVVKSGSNHPKA